jgi:hypothetical protein
MTKYTTLNRPDKKEYCKTTFNKVVMGNSIELASCLPAEFDHVLFLGYDELLGDVFQAWDNNVPGFFIYIGKKGTEFND